MTALRKISKEEKYTYNDYKNWKDNEDWEIIGGNAYAMAPSPNTKHQNVSANIFYEIRNYLKDKSCKVFYELDVVLSNEDVVKPDIFIVCDKKKITDNNIQGTPDMIVEVLSPSTTKRDKIIKLDIYKKYGVKEYWIVDPSNEYISVYYFDDNTQENYFYEDEEIENFISVKIFKDELKINIKDIFTHD